MSVAFMFITHLYLFDCTIVQDAKFEIFEQQY